MLAGRSGSFQALPLRVALTDFGAGVTGAEAPKSNTQGSPRSVPMTQKAGWLVQLCLLAPIYAFILFFFKERNIRKTFALTLNPPPHVTVIAGPGGGKKSIIPIWGQPALTILR